MSLLSELPAFMTSWFSEKLMWNLITGALLLIIGLPLASLLARMGYRITAVRISVQTGQILSRILRWFLFLGFGDSSINFLLGVWMVKTDYLLVRNSIALQVQQAFAREDIEIPFPHQVIAGGKASAPIEIRIARDSSIGS